MSYKNKNPAMQGFLFYKDEALLFVSTGVWTNANGFTVQSTFGFEFNITVNFSE